ncbi:hypothetical protein O71_04046 [Pontibacter sp. BAB1700]|nr:hypothetical protein O71_04046 [Pontibacter sp. BAB1700]
MCECAVIVIPNPLHDRLIRLVQTLPHAVLFLIRQAAFCNPTKKYFKKIKNTGLPIRVSGMKFKFETKTLNHKHKMKNLFKFAFVAFALVAFTACNTEETATETEAVETEVVETEEVVTEEVEADTTVEVEADTTVTVQ